MSRSPAQTPAAAPAAPPPDAAPETGKPFWRTTPLAAMSTEQWESLCDGCGRCCLVKLEDEDSGAIAYTDVACRLFDRDSCRCADYAHRSEQVADCVRLTPEAVASLSWLPPTCAYRLLDEGKDLPFWHPLVSGDPDSVRAAGISVAGKVAGLEDEFGLFELVDHLATWPVRWPKGAKGPAKGPANPKPRARRR
ncbi:MULTISPECIES: YcgN family cysteine cluster protein [unclassified Xanthobacter]|uniref:YcgN family cysteine cluster protein n=1 Tax=unclassified Xanthobacter TaxID=2623496 RepID=UPI003FD308AD